MAAPTRIWKNVASFYHPQKSNMWKLLLASQSRQRGYCNVVEDAGNFKSFDESLLKYLVCPLTKEPLKYDKEKNELISEKAGVAYPIVKGIPNLVPQDGRLLNTDGTDKH